MRTGSNRHGLRAPRPLSVVRYVVQVALTSVAVAAAAVVIVPKLLGWEGVLVLTGSMEPTVDAGGVAFVDKVPADDIRVGDIMTFTRANSDQQLTHRVTAVTQTEKGLQFRTKGDANRAPDGWTVTPRQVIGKVRFALPNLGVLGRLLVSDRQLLALLMAVPAAFLLADEVRRGRQQRAAVRRWLAEEAMRVPVVDEPLPASRPRRTRKTLAGT